VKIGKVEIKGMTALAPMAGVADTALRTLCRAYGAAYVVGEMASAKGLCMSGRKSRELLSVTDAERPMAVQLFGDDPATMAEAARIAMEYRPDIIDINMGCPAPKVVNNGAGSALMRSPVLAGRIIEAVASAVPVPVTAKIRKGWDNGHINAVELAKIVEGSGAAAITVHGRTRGQQYAPPVDLDIIAAVKRAVAIPVIGNGDVTTPEGARAMLDKTGCDLVMIGRGALGNPWLFARTEAYLSTGSLPPEPQMRERVDVMLRHIRLLCDVRGEHSAMCEARKHAAWYLRGMRGAAGFRDEAFALERYEDLLSLADKVLASEHGA
jgi:tRNA-dihydrouridine synthase B